MRVYEGMNDVVLSVGPGHTLRVAARLMSERNVGAAVRHGSSRVRGSLARGDGSASGAGS